MNNIIDFSKIDLKSLIAISVIGFVFMLIISNIRWILYSVCKVLALYLMPNSLYYGYFDIIPYLIMVIFWSLLVFKYLDNFNINYDLSLNISKKYIIGIIITVILLIVIRGVSFNLSNYLETIWRIKYTRDWSIITIKQIIDFLLETTEQIIILIGFYKILNKSIIKNNRDKKNQVLNT